MSKRQIYILLGVWVIILPFSGIPTGLWQNLLHLFPGLAIIMLSYVYGEEKKTFGGSAHPFVDSVRNMPKNEFKNESVKSQKIDSVIEKDESKDVAQEVQQIEQTQLVQDSQIGQVDSSQNNTVNLSSDGANKE